MLEGAQQEGAEHGPPPLTSPVGEGHLGAQRAPSGARGVVPLAGRSPAPPHQLQRAREAPGRLEARGRQAAVALREGRGPRVGEGHPVVPAPQAAWAPLGVRDSRAVQALQGALGPSVALALSAASALLAGMDLQGARN